MLTPAIGRPLEICPKNEVGPRVSFRDQIETEAVMKLWGEVALSSNQSFDGYISFIKFQRRRSRISYDR